MPRLKDMYKEQVAPALMKQFEYSSVMQIPKFDKIVINIGAGDAKENSKVIDNIIKDLTIIAGQKAVPTVAKKSVANFKLRQGMMIGAKVTLRGNRMYEFMDRLFNFAL
ncbi:MAG: 50S ribosomal protein L5, partial [Clostridia bacterium]|nr:50S ribosomal protein L5 [Clostridia bacterium]